MSAAGADYEQNWLRRGEDEQSFMTTKGGYLQGLQARVLGEADANPDSKAGTLFRKCAYVADTFHPKSAPVRTML